MQSDKSIASFASRLEAATDLHKAIGQLIDNHLGVDPENVNWSNVGDADRLVDALSEIVKSFSK